MSIDTKVLVVEDNTPGLKYLRDVLEQHGYYVLVSKDKESSPYSIEGIEEAVELLVADKNELSPEDLPKIIELLLSVYDISIKKDQEIKGLRNKIGELENNIENLEKNYEDLIEMDSDAVVILDQKKNIQFANPAAEKLFQCSLDNLIGRSFDFYMAKDDIREVNFLKGDGKEIIVEMRILEFNWKGNNAFLASLRDVTEYKKTEEALQESIEREARAHAQGRLEIVDTILHNIGNAINSVTIGIGTIQENIANNKLTRHLSSLAKAVKIHEKDFSEYVKEDAQGRKVAPLIIALAEEFESHDKEILRIVNRVNKTSERIADIIRTEKTLSKRSAYNKLINLKESINYAVIVLQESIKSRNIELTISYDSAPEEIKTQESQFHQMMVNLIKNSIEAIDELRKSEFEQENAIINIDNYRESDSLVIEITDNGIGIEQDKLDIIFRSGYTTKESGSGLGLHSIANFIKGCGGQILAFSDGIGKGTTMKIVLPRSPND
ncbi:PAS domain S-box protein [Candidatus Poribacteria bacterium]|nr:PAS domain S-box protein [Candidatus Poribacteria bacterium]